MQRWPWQVSVWTRFRATPAEVWALQTDPDRVRAAFGPALAFRIGEPGAFRDAIASATAGKFGGKLTGPIGVLGVDWPFELRDVKPLESFVDSSENAVFESFVHTHRLESATDGFVRYTDEVRFVPRVGPEAWVAAAVRRLFVARHKRVAGWLPSDPLARGVAIVRRVNPAGTELEEPDMEGTG